MEGRALASVLLIADNPADARLVREYLGERPGERCRVGVAVSLASEIVSLERRHPDVVLLDLSLPDSRGLDTFYRVHTTPATRRSSSSPSTTTTSKVWPRCEAAPRSTSPSSTPTA